MFAVVWYINISHIHYSSYNSVIPEEVRKILTGIGAFLSVKTWRRHDDFSMNLSFDKPAYRIFG
jgi:hypothetical protein